MHPGTSDEAGEPGEQARTAPNERRNPIEEEIASRIRRRGPLPFSEVMALALYDPDHGFYATGGHAGRHGDFITSPEVGPLFGAVIARYLDEVWRELGRPDPFVVVEAGAGIGTLAIALRAAAPDCLSSMTYVLVEQSTPLRDRHHEYLDISDPALAFAPRRPGQDDREDDTSRSDAGRDAEGAATASTAGPSSTEPGKGSGPRFVSLAELPMLAVVGVVIANELLDNLPFDIVARRNEGWHEVRVALDEDDQKLVEFEIPADEAHVSVGDRLARDLDEGMRIPIQTAALQWLRRAIETVEQGRVLLIDYGADTAVLGARPSGEWLRTYRGHGRGGPMLDELGTQDITADVAVDQLAATRPPNRQWAQADFLRDYGIDDLVDEGRRIWDERAPIGDLEAIKARSRVREAEALLDLAGLGSFVALEWRIEG